MLSKLSVRTTVAVLAAIGLLATAPSATAAFRDSDAPPAGSPATAAQSPSAGVTVKMPAAVADRLGTDRKALIDAVSADVLSRSDAAKGLTSKAAVGKLAGEGRKVVVDVRTVSVEAGLVASRTSKRPAPTTASRRAGSTSLTARTGNGSRASKATANSPITWPGPRWSGRRSGGP